jgi:hypothetical protein
MESNAFFMLGVIHRDDSGPALLKDWFERIRPDVITLELTHYGLRFRRELGGEYKKAVEHVATLREERGDPVNREAMSSLLSYFSIPYEYEEASAYAAIHDVPLYLVDMDFFSYVKLRTIEDLINEKNVETMLAEKPGLNNSQEMTAAKLYFEKGVAINQYDREMYIRDRYMSARIQDLMRGRKGKKFLHLCGWQHLQDPYGLYSHFNPIKVFSHDKTFCI